MESIYVNLSPATALSPLDGRYCEKTRSLSPFFSELALMRFRLLVEVEWLIFLSDTVKVIRPISQQNKKYLRQQYSRFTWSTFTQAPFKGIKDIEEKIHHDVNSVVRYFKKIVEEEPSMSDLAEFVHIGLTSEDVNNLAFCLMLRGGTEIIRSAYSEVNLLLCELASREAETPLLAHTHGQPASPTTIGWEVNVFTERLDDASEVCTLNVKFGSATGGHNALYAAWPKINWRHYSEQFVSVVEHAENDSHSVGFRFNPYCTQRESMDSYAKLFNSIRRANNILIDFDRDMWTYISMGIFIQVPKATEDGSSAMPNKVNPIDFENSEGNLGVANALFSHFSDKLPISRLQRDLTDSTVVRNFGVAFGYTLLALDSLKNGLGKVNVNREKVMQMLEENWAVIAEGIQTILRRERVAKSYDLLKDLTRGKVEITQEKLHEFIDQVAMDNDLSPEVVAELKALTPFNYIGNREFEKISLEPE